MNEEEEFDVEEFETDELFDADPSCKHELVNKWSGIKCKKCKGWFCY